MATVRLPTLPHPLVMSRVKVLVETTTTTCRAVGRTKWTDCRIGLTRIGECHISYMYCRCKPLLHVSLVYHVSAINSDCTERLGRRAHMTDASRVKNRSRRRRHTFDRCQPVIGRIYKATCTRLHVTRTVRQRWQGRSGHENCARYRTHFSIIVHFASEPEPFLRTLLSRQPLGLVRTSDR